MSSTPSLAKGVPPFCFIVLFTILFDCVVLRTLVAVSAISIGIALGIQHIQHQGKIAIQTKKTGQDRSVRCKEIVSGSFLKHESDSKHALTFYQSRAFPNKRLVAFFGINNGFTSFNEQFCGEFRARSAGILNISESSWEGLMERAGQVTRNALSQHKDTIASTGIPLIPLVQLIVFQFMLPLILPDSIIQEDAKAISVVTEAINSLWMASKTETSEASALHKNVLKEGLHRILPNTDWAPESSPLNLILPAYETAWRAVFHSYTSIAIRNDHRSTQWQVEFDDFAKNPTKSAFQRIKNSGTSIEYIIIESLRLYPPTKTIYRQTVLPTANRDGVVESANILGLHRDPEIWGPSSLYFDPTRWFKVDKEDKRLYRDAFMAFGSRPHICPAQTIAPVLIALLVGALVAEFGPDKEVIVTGRDLDIHSSEPLRTERDAYASLRILRT